MKSPRPWLFLAGMVAVFAPVLQAADEGQPRELLQPPQSTIASPITDRFALRGGYYQPSIDMPLRYDSSTGTPGTPISGEDTLGFDDKLDQGTFELMYRMGDRHRMRMDFLMISRAAYVLIDQDIQFGDETYFENDAVLSKMDMWMLGMTYTYSVFRRETVEVGVGLGVHLMQLQAESGVPARLIQEEFDVAGPLATLAVDGAWRFTPRFSANARAQYLSGNVDEVDGSFLNYHADVQFRWRPNLAFGLGYTNWSMRFDSTDESFSGRVVLKARGPEAFVRVSF